VIDAERLRKMFFLFGLTLPTGDDIQNETFKTLFGGELKQFIPIVMQQICEEMIKHPDSSEGYLDFIVEAISYAKGDSDELPSIEGKTSEEIEIILNHR